MDHAEGCRMVEFERGDNAGEYVEYSVEYRQECCCKDRYPVDSSYLVGGEDELLGRNEEGGVYVRNSVCCNACFRNGHSKDHGRCEE